MKKIQYLFLMLLPLLSFAQKEGQIFCEGDNDAEYFPLNIGRKTIRWYNTTYKETLLGDQVFGEKKYLAYEQAWSDGQKDTLYLRQDGPKVMELKEKNGVEILRYDNRQNPSDTWNGNYVKYTLLSYHEILTTPVCHYQGLLAIKAAYEKVTYIFYYLRGYGYVGATKDGKLISYVVPKN